MLYECTRTLALLSGITQINSFIQLLDCDDNPNEFIYDFVRALADPSDIDSSDVICLFKTILSVRDYIEIHENKGDIMKKLIAEITSYSRPIYEKITPFLHEILLKTERCMIAVNENNIAVLRNDTPLDCLESLLDYESVAIKAVDSQRDLVTQEMEDNALLYYKEQHQNFVHQLLNYITTGDEFVARLEFISRLCVLRKNDLEEESSLEEFDIVFVFGFLSYVVLRYLTLDHSKDKEPGKILDPSFFHCYEVDF